MAPYPGLVGGSATVRTPNHNAERTINFYVEVAPGAPKVPARLAATPGFQPFAMMADGPVRALFAQDGRAFAVSGTSLYELTAGGAAILRGTTIADGKPATISSNGSNGGQLFITHGGKGYIYSLVTDTITALEGLVGAEGFPLPVAMGLFSDGYFLALKADSNQFNISSLYDGLEWDALDVFQVSTVADKVVAMAESHREIWLLGSQTSSVWSNTGDADTPFQPIGGVKILQGCGAAFSVALLDNTLYWLGGNERGSRIVYRAKGYSPERVSDHGLEYVLNQYPRVDDAIAWSYQDEGHTFYVLYLPSQPAAGIDHTTWVYDVATGLWHERAAWNTVTAAWEPHLGRAHCYAFGKHLIGDRTSGAVYELSLDLYNETRTVAA